MLGLPASTLYAYSNGFYIAAVAIAAICTLLIYQSAAAVVKDEKATFDAYKIEASKEVASAYAEGVKAGKEAAEAKAAAAVAEQKAAEANARAAEANARAEEAIKQTAEARLVTEELRKQTIPREFTLEQLTGLASLAGSGIKIEVDALYGDPEATIYAVQFVHRARQLGIESSSVNPKMDAMFFGIKIFGPEDGYTEKLLQIFSVPGTNVMRETSDTYRVYVGSRLPPFIQP